MRSAPVTDFDSWRVTARSLLAEGVPPAEATWSAGLFDEPFNVPRRSSSSTVPKDFLDLAKTLAMHRDERRWDLLYRVLYRIAHRERNLLKVDIDEDVREPNLMAKAVAPDMHQMKQLVRFRRLA